MVGKFFNQLQELHEAERTCPTLQDPLLDALKFEIFGNPPVFADHNNNEEVTQSRMEQTRLGWGADSSPANGPKSSNNFW
jgi:hypothetical protein